MQEILCHGQYTTHQALMVPKTKGESVNRTSL